MLFSEQYMPRIYHTENNSFPSFIAYVSFFLSNWLSFLRQKLVKQCMFLSQGMHKIVKRKKSQKSTEQQCLQR